jgi:hypothetical protein
MFRENRGPSSTFKLMFASIMMIIFIMIGFYFYVTYRIFDSVEANGGAKETIIKLGREAKDINEQIIKE